MASNSYSESNKLYEHLKSELSSKTDLKQLKSKLNRLNDYQKESENNDIYKFKLEKSKGDSLFSSVNDPLAKIGSTLGVRTNSYLDHVKRFQMSKELISQAEVYERNLIRGFTDLVVRKVWRHKMNYTLKAGLAVIFLYNFSKANESKNLFQLRKHTPATTKEVLGFYYTPAVSFAFASLAFALI